MSVMTRERPAPAPPPPAAPHRPSAGARAERRLAFMLCAPAVLVMVGVTAYPLGYAVWLSLQRYDLRFPQLAKFVGLANYGAVLSSPYWWHAFWVTAIITVPCT